MNNRVNFAARSSISCLLLLSTLSPAEDSACSRDSDLESGADSRFEEALGVCMGVAAVLPFIACICFMASFVWQRKVRVSTYLNQRLDFTENLRDITSIVMSMESLKLRKFTSMLLDNDLKDLTEALDLLQFAILKMQPKEFTAWRVEQGESAFPFKVMPDGGLEAYVTGLGLKQHDDLRDIARIFQHALFKTGVNSSKDMPGVVQAIARGKRKLSKDDFVSGVLEYFSQHKLYFGTNDKIPKVDELESIFDHFDVDSSASLTSEEVLASISWVVNLPPQSTDAQIINDIAAMKLSMKEDLVRKTDANKVSL